MFEEIRKGLLSGLGAVLLTKEKADEATRKLVAEAKMSREDAQKLVDELFENGTRQWSELESSLTRTLRKGIDSLDLASKKEVHGLKSKVGKLEKRIAVLEEQPGQDKES